MIMRNFILKKYLGTTIRLGDRGVLRNNSEASPFFAKIRLSAKRRPVGHSRFARIPQKWNAEQGKTATML